MKRLANLQLKVGASSASKNWQVNNFEQELEIRYQKFMSGSFANWGYFRANMFCLLLNIFPYANSAVPSSHNDTPILHEQLTLT